MTAQAQAHTADFAHLLDDGLFDTPLRTHFAAMAAGLAANIGTTTVLGIVVESVAVAVLSFTGATWLALAVWFLGWVCALVAGLYAGGYAVRYVYDRRFTNDVKAAKEKTTEVLRNASYAVGDAWEATVGWFKK